MKIRPYRGKVDSTFDSTFESAVSLPLKLDQFPSVMSDFSNICKEDLLLNIVKFIQGIFHIFCLSEDIVDFLNLQGKLEPKAVINRRHLMDFKLNIRIVQGSDQGWFKVALKLKKNQLKMDAK